VGAHKLKSLFSVLARCFTRYRGLPVCFSGTAASVLTPQSSRRPKVLEDERDNLMTELQEPQKLQRQQSSSFGKPFSMSKYINGPALRTLQEQIEYIVQFFRPSARDALKAHLSGMNFLQGRARFAPNFVLLLLTEILSSSSTSSSSTSSSSSSQDCPAASAGRCPACWTPLDTT
jgi:hypothetical protein